jgi:hypothetical protein
VQMFEFEFEFDEYELLHLPLETAAARCSSVKTLWLLLILMLLLLPFIDRCSFFVESSSTIEATTCHSQPEMSLRLAPSSMVSTHVEHTHPKYDCCQEKRRSEGSMAFYCAGNRIAFLKR